VTFGYGQGNTMTNGRKGFTVALSLILVVEAAEMAAGQDAPAGPDLVSMIPREAVFHLERRGHHAVRDAFLASNFGRMAMDEAINQFAHGSRVRIGQMIVKEMFDLDTPKEIDRHQKLLHEVLKPFWYNPCAMYVVLGEDFSRGPGVAFLCVTGKYQSACKEALEALMRVGVPKKGLGGRRQAFTYRKHAAVWQGVAKSHKEFTLPEDPREQAKALAGQTLFMTYWFGDILFVATNLPAADAASRMLSVVKPGKPKAGEASYQAVMKRTAMKDWAFRWYFDVEVLMGAAKKAEGGKLPEALVHLQLDKIRGAGGTGGYMEKVYARRTYVYVPDCTGGPLRFLTAGGSYKKALAMAPDTASILLAGQADTKRILDLIEEMTGLKAAAARPAGKGPPDPQSAKALEQMRKLASASTGQVALCMSEVQGMAGMMAGGGPPIGAVMGLTDSKKALEAIDELIRLAGIEEDDEAEEARAKPGTYRKTPIRYLSDSVRLAVMEDRVAIAMSDNTMKAFVDAALDGTGGFAPDGKDEAMARRLPDGSAIFKLDLAAIARLAWPMLMQQAERSPEEFPFVSMPSAGKMARMLGPELAVLSPDADGLMMESRGKVPFATKTMLAYPMIGWFVFAMMF